MKNYVILLAGGVGSRMNENTPKQFLMLKGKPVIVHTIENFQRNNSIDKIVVVCVKEWMGHLQKIVEQYGLYKVAAIVEGGETGHDSTRNGLFFLRDKIDPNDNVIIHDAARPILPQKAIDLMIEMANLKGNACLAIPCYETVILTDDKESGIKDLDRNSFMRVQTPQAYRFGDILPLYEMAESCGLHNFVYADLVYTHYGKRVYFSKGFINNIKITQTDDLALCEALMEFTEEQLFGK